MSQTLCEEKNEEEEINIIQSECCACEEAKYEIMFQVRYDNNKSCKQTFAEI